MYELVEYTMKKHPGYFIFIFLLLFSIQSLQSQVALDSLLRVREIHQQEYQNIVDTLTSMSWLNMYYSSRSLKKVVETDNRIIAGQLPYLKNRIIALDDSIKHLNRQIGEMKLRNDDQRKDLDHIQYHYDFLFFTLGAVALLGFIFLVLFIIYFIRSRKFRKRLVSSDQSGNMETKEYMLLKSKYQEVIDRERILTARLQKIDAEHNELKAERDDLLLTLDRERSTRKNLEEEMKKIIDEYKK